MSRSVLTEGISFSPSLNKDATWQMSLSVNEMMEEGIYPERPGEPDCSYYLRTGLCRFGATCRFNHPHDRNLAIATANMKGEYPERFGQPDCQYYLKTGTCKFGATCKFHHPKNREGITGRVSLNILGYPLRPNEVECAYYLRTGHCKFGSTCKYNHPQPANMIVPLRSTIYSNIQSPNSGQQSYPWSSSSLIASPRWQDASNYASLLFPQGMVSIQGWNTYGGQLGSVNSSDMPQHSLGNRDLRSVLSNDPANLSPQTNFPFRSGSLPVGFYTLRRENVFPERPGHPECQFYMKTGDCKFGSVCKFHHPRDRKMPAPDCLLSALGLPLRPGEPVCIFYSRYGICKFGPSCKFDHPMRVLAYNVSMPSSGEEPVGHVLETSSGAAALYLSTQDLEAAPGKSRRLSLAETRAIPSGSEAPKTEE